MDAFNLDVVKSIDWDLDASLLKHPVSESLLVLPLDGCELLNELIVISLEPD